MLQPNIRHLKIEYRLNRSPIPCSLQNPNNLKMKAPNLRRRPLFVSGIPIALEILDLKAETPINRQIEKPPKFISFLSVSRESLSVN